MTAWADQLDRFEASLAEQRRAVAEGRPQDVEAFLPQPAGPLPTDLAQRARALAEQAEALTAELTAAAGSAARQLQVLAVMHGAQQPSSSYVDQRG